MTRDLFRAMSLALRQKCPQNVVEMNGAMAAFFENLENFILVQVLTEVWSLENIASCNWRKIAVAWSDSVLLMLRSLVCMWKTFGKGGLFLLSLFTACSVQLRKKRNCKVVEEKLLGFVLVYKWACTELHGSDNRRAYYNVIQNVFVV